MEFCGNSQKHPSSNGNIECTHLKERKLRCFEKNPLQHYYVMKKNGAWPILQKFILARNGKEYAF